MPRLTGSQWEDIRAGREAGRSFRDLAEEYNVSHQAIMKQAKAGGWGDGSDVGEIVRRKVAAKVAGVVATDNPKKKAVALNSAADRAFEVLRRHQEEPEVARERVHTGLKAHKEAQTKEDKALAFDDLKAAKIAAEAMQIIHSMERKAWHLDAESAQSTIVIERGYGTR
jgi:hypothetical protein